MQIHSPASNRVTGAPAHCMPDKPPSRAYVGGARDEPDPGQGCRVSEIARIWRPGPRPVRPKNASVPCPANQPSSRHDGPLDPGHCKITGQLGRHPTLVATLDCDPGDLYRDPGYFIAILW